MSAPALPGFNPLVASAPDTGLIGWLDSIELAGEATVLPGALILR